MFSFVTNPLDRWAIRMALTSITQNEGSHRAAEAEALLEQPEYFPFEVPAPSDLTFVGSREFQFASTVKTAWAENNVVYGKLYRAGAGWQKKPSIVLLHGWNGELGYRYQFPYLAWRLAKAGINTAMLELPYHARRKPQSIGAIRNFISHDLFCMVEGTQQAMLDTRALMSWLAAQGSPSVGLWGISLGAWLTGLITATEPKARFAVLMSPVVRMDRAVQELPFCEPVRRSLAKTHLSLERFNLISHKPAPTRENILIIESRHDLFAPVETVEELWAGWGEPEIWRLAHGHISVLASVPVMEKAVKWVAEKCEACAIGRLETAGRGAR